MTSRTPTKALIYTRVSLDAANGRSVAEQETDCRNECERQGWIVAEVLSDNSVGASRHSKGRRPGWDRVKKRITAGEIDVLVVWEASRATRDLSVFAELQTLLASTGTKLSYSGRLLDLDDDDDIFTAGLDALVSGKAAGDTSKRVRRAMRSNADQGKPHGRLLYGYKRLRDENTGKPVGQVLDDDQAPIVAKIFAMYNGGKSRTDVAAALNSEGVERENGGPWDPRRVSGIITNAAYAGRRTYKGEDVGESSWPAIVDMATFAIAAKRREAANMNKKRARGSTRLLSSVGRCGVCGSKIRSSKAKSGHAYACISGKCVYRVGVPLDAFVGEAIVARLSVPDARETLSSNDTPPAVSEAAVRVAELEAKLEEAADQFAAGELSVSMLSKVEQRLAPLIAEARRVQRQAAVPMDIDVPETGLEAWWDGLDRSVAREVVSALISSVVINRTRRGARSFDPASIEIEWAA